MHCIYGTGIQTGVKYVYGSLEDVMAVKPPVNVIYGDGDGTLNIEALKICQKWKDSAGTGDAKVIVLTSLYYGHIKSTLKVNLYIFKGSFEQNFQNFGFNF